MVNIASLSLMSVHLQNNLLCSYKESLKQRHVKENKRLTIFISSQFKTGNMNHVMNLQFLIFAFNHILETSDYCTWDFVGGE